MGVHEPITAPQFELAWLPEYLALPFVPRGRTRAGVDCWGIPVLVYAERLGIALPHVCGYAGSSTRADAAALADLVEGAATGWVEVWRRTADSHLPPAADVQPFDVLLMRMMAAECHVGLITRPGRVLHTMATTGPLHENYTRGLRSHAVAAVYRHPELMA